MERIKDISIGIVLLAGSMFIYSDHGKSVPQLDEVVLSISLFGLGIVMIISGFRKKR